MARRERRALEEVLWRGVSSDPLVFLSVCRTVDEHAPAGSSALRAFPVCARCALDAGANVAVRLVGEVPNQVSVCRAHGREHKPYFRPLTRAWQAAEIFPIEKARQMLITWWAVAVHLLEAMRQPGALIAFQSLNREKSCELLERAEILYRGLPRELQRFGPMSDAPKASARRIEDRITFTHEVDGRPVEARLLALPNGPHHVRMYTLTSILMDECTMWEQDEDFEESYAAALATIKGGGRLTAIASVNTAGRFHYRLCRGQVA